MTEGLRSSGCRILFASEASLAPFIITAESATGERFGIVAYAFLATRTPTKNRPSDERSFQIKYGNKHDYFHENSHQLWQDPLGLFTTLLIGIDTRENFFVAADPAMHNPTKFFIRLEFKDRDADEIIRASWHSWERDKHAVGGYGEPIEVLVGGTQERFLDLVRFERAACGLSPGDRQLLAERSELFNARAEQVSPIKRPTDALHPLASEFELTPEQILELIASARRLKMAVRGWVAEEHLRATLTQVPGVTYCERSDEEGGADLLIRYKERQIIKIECKNVLRKTTRMGEPRIDFQRTRAAKADPCSRYYTSRDFEIVAACLHAVSENWDFRYVLPGSLPHHPKCDGRISNNVVVGSNWFADPIPVFEAAYASLL